MLTNFLFMCYLLSNESLFILFCVNYEIDIFVCPPFFISSFHKKCSYFLIAPI